MHFIPLWVNVKKQTNNFNVIIFLSRHALGMTAFYFPQSLCIEIFGI